MFVLLSVTLCFLGYFMCTKLLYNRFTKQWPSLRNSVVFSPSPAKNVNLPPTRDLPSCRTCENNAGALDEVRVLLVTAHPDDECMFFAPAVLKLTESNAAVYLLCLSSGNYYNQGVRRKEELLSSCAVLGIPAHRVTVIDHGELQDDPKTEWSIALAASLILKHITTNSINLVLTFDERGVSGHANHIAIYKALSWVNETQREVALLWAKPGHHGDFQELGYGFRAPSNHTHLAFVGRIPKGCQVLSLHTISILRKYLSIFELPISWLLPSSLCCIIGPNEYRKAKEAMLHHRSQLLWFRRLYILFSRYMFINTFRAIPVEKTDVRFY